LAAIIQNKPFDSAARGIWTSDAVIQVLRSIPLHLFQSPRSIGRQRTFRHRSPLKQRNLKEETARRQTGSLVLGPAAHRNPKSVNLGLEKALEFYYWLESSSRFRHDEATCKEMALILVKGNRMNLLWDFLKNMSKRHKAGSLVTTPTMTSLIKALGEEGMANEAASAFYRMKQFSCKPDVCAYNNLIHALCRVGFFDRARSLLAKMELPGFRCPPDVYTYTIMIASYCRFAFECGSRKAVRRRIWEANRLFRLMIFKGHEPDVVTYNSLINGCCKTSRIERALELLEDMEKRGCLPNRITYNSFIRYFSVVNEVERAVKMLRTMQEKNRGVPSSSSYTPIVHSLCEAGRGGEALSFVEEMVAGGSVPREYTYKLVFKSVGGSVDPNLAKLVETKVQDRIRCVRKAKPLMGKQKI
ncbi:binding protein, partial [Genlisea aurea]